MFPLPACCCLPVTEQNVRTVHLESAGQMEGSLCRSSNLLIACERRRLAHKAPEANRADAGENLHIRTTGSVGETHLSGRGERGQKVARQLSSCCFFFLYSWLQVTGCCLTPNCKITVNSTTTFITSVRKTDRNVHQGHRNTAEWKHNDACRLQTGFNYFFL